jgi:hypothetical protein
MAAIAPISFALFHRFGPNLKDRQWRWSAPGAVFGGILWLAASLLFSRIFRPLLLISSNLRTRRLGRDAADVDVYDRRDVLIGAEMNSESRRRSGRRRPADSSPKNRNEFDDQNHDHH